MTTIAGLVEQLRARIPAGAGGFLSWWGNALASWLPLRWRKLLGLTRDRLLLQVQGEQVDVRWQDTLGVRPVAPLPAPLQVSQLEQVLDPRLSHLPLWLLLPADTVLRRSLLLPASAADRLHDVMRFELDRQTPFTADNAYFDAHIRQRRADGQIEAELVVVPRQREQQERQVLGQVSESLAGIGALTAQGEVLAVNLLPLSERRQRQASNSLFGWVLGGVAVILLLFAAWQVLENRRQAASEFEARIRGQAEQARVVAQERQQLVDLVQGMTALDSARAARPTSVEILDELAQRLPDNTYVEKLSIEGERLLIMGLSSEASGLIARMQDSKLWRSPALSGALQPDPNSQRDRFTMTAELVGSTTLDAGQNTGGADEPQR